MSDQKTPKTWDQIQAESKKNQSSQKASQSSVSSTSQSSNAKTSSTLPKSDTAVKESASLDLKMDNKPENPGQVQQKKANYDSENSQQKNQDQNPGQRKVENLQKNRSQSGETEDLMANHHQSQHQKDHGNPDSDPSDGASEKAKNARMGDDRDMQAFAKSINWKNVLLAAVAVNTVAAVMIGKRSRKRRHKPEMDLETLYHELDKKYGKGKRRFARQAERKANQLKKEGKHLLGVAAKKASNLMDFEQEEKSDLDKAVDSIKENIGYVAEMAENMVKKITH